MELVVKSTSRRVDEELLEDLKTRRLDD